MLRLTDLREILRYVPRFRDRVFVIAPGRRRRRGRELPQPAARHRPVAQPEHPRRPGPRGRPSGPPARRRLPHHAVQPRRLRRHRRRHACASPCWPPTASRTNCSKGCRPPTCAAPSPTPWSPIPAGILQGVDHRDRPRRARGHGAAPRPAPERHRAGHSAGRQRRRGQFLPPQLRQRRRRGRPRPPGRQADLPDHLPRHPRPHVAGGRPGGGAAAAAVGRRGRRRS